MSLNWLKYICESVHFQLNQLDCYQDVRCWWCSRRENDANKSSAESETERERVDNGGEREYENGMVKEYGAHAHHRVDRREWWWFMIYARLTNDCVLIINMRQTKSMKHQICVHPHIAYTRARAGILHMEFILPKWMTAKTDANEKAIPWSNWMLNSMPFFSFVNFSGVFCFCSFTIVLLWPSVVRDG